MVKRSWLMGLVGVVTACSDAPVEASASSSSVGNESSSGTTGPDAITTTSDASSSDVSSATVTADSTSTHGSTTDPSETMQTTTDTSTTAVDETTQSGTTGVATTGVATTGVVTTGVTETSTSTSESSETATTERTSDGTSNSGSESGQLGLDVGGGGAVCGDGMLDEGEVCDDANLIGGDGCEADCTSSDDVQPIWTLEQGGPFGFADCGGGVAFDSEDNLILAGIWEDQIWVGKYDVDYVQVWEATYPAVSGAGGCMWVRVAVDPAGNVAVIGPQDSATLYDVFVALLDPDGAEQWTATFAGPFAQTDEAGDITFDLAGNVLVTGALASAPMTASFWVEKLSPAGATLWSDSVVGAGGWINDGRGIAADAEGNVWSVGATCPQLFETDIFMRRYDAGGEILATDNIVGVDDASQDLAYDIVLDEFGDRIVVGTYRVDADVDNNDTWVRRYEGDVEQWMTTFDGSGPFDVAVGVALAPDGTVVTSGVIYDAPEGGLRNRWLAKLEADGTPIWERRVHESSSEGWNGVAVASDGRIAVAGVAAFAFPWAAEARYAVYPP